MHNVRDFTGHSLEPQKGAADHGARRLHLRLCERVTNEQTLFGPKIYPA
jgi:hypothetical protein